MTSNTKNLLFLFTLYFFVRYCVYIIIFVPYIYIKIMMGYEQPILAHTYGRYIFLPKFVSEYVFLLTFVV